MVDEGIVINTDSENLENKVRLRETKPTTESSGGYFKSVNFLIILAFLKCKVYAFKRNKFIKYKINKYVLV